MYKKVNWSGETLIDQRMLKGGLQIPWLYKVTELGLVAQVKEDVLQETDGFSFN